MKDKTFEYIKNSIDDAQDLFYGQTMTQEQYDAIDDMWEVFRHTYMPCRPTALVDDPNSVFMQAEKKTTDRPYYSEEELLANICAAAEEIDVAKESADFVAIPNNSISKRFALKKYLGIDPEGYDPLSITEIFTNISCCTDEGKGSLVKYLPGGDADRYDKAMKVIK